MGCSDSKSMKRNYYNSSFNPTSKISSNNSKSFTREQSNQKFPQNNYGQNSRIVAFYQELQDMYQQCNKDMKKFIMMIEQKVSQVYMGISQQTLANMNHQEIAAEQSKIIISEEILSLNLNVLKVIGRNKNFEYDKETFKELNKFQSHLVGYLKTKYPRGQQTFVSGDLMKLFKQFDRVNDLNYDILKNSNTYFGEPEDEKIIKGIKVFMNKVMRQCDKYFPEFQKLMQQRAFFIKNEKGEKATLNYKIGRKISENVAKYEDLETGVLQVFSPQVFRVFIKWMEDLEETVRNTSEKINKKQSFKCYIGEKQVTNEDLNPAQIKKQKELIFDYINKYEYDKIVDKMISRIDSLKPKLESKNIEFVQELDDFNQRLLKVLNQADPKQRYVPTKQIETIKYSSFNAKFVEYILTEKLVYVIKELIKVGQSFIGQNSMNLDVIKFRVSDLMRCQVSGNKKEILQIYNNFKRLEQEGKIEIIKIKNRLSTPLNDAMIIFVMKDSWIICEAQLVLSESGEKIDKRSKNTELVNHYFYELERSPYGIMAEIAVLLAYKDSKIVYQNKITFHQSDVDIEKCRLKHKNSIIENQEQKTPFICSKCSGFYRKSQNLFKLYQCKQCKTAICSRCILKKNPELENSFIMRDINRQLQQKISQVEKSGKQKRQAATIKNVTKKMNPKSILNLFDQEIMRLKSEFDNQKKSERKVQVYKLMQKLDYNYGINRIDPLRYFLVANFSRGQAAFKIFSYDPQYRQIQNTSDSRQKYDESSYFSYTEYDLLFMFSIYQTISRQKLVTPNHLFLFMTKNELQAKIDQVKKMKSEGKINKDEQYEIVSIKLKDSSTQLVLDYNTIREKKDDNKFDSDEYNDYNTYQKKQFKYPSLNVLGDKLPPLKSARTDIEFDDLGIQTKHLDYFRDLSWRHSIKQLKLANNKIQNVTILFDSLNSLQRFYFNDNFVKQLRFNKPLQNLEILNGSRNLIASISGLDNISRIRKLLLESNKLKDFPKSMNLNLLNVLNLKANYLSNVLNLLNADFPQLQQLMISEQLIKNREQDDVRSQQSEDNLGKFIGRFWKKGDKQELMVIEYPNLRNFQSQDNSNLLIGKQITFYSDSLQKISLNNCSIDRIIFNRRQCIENLKYLHLSGNKIKRFTFLGANQVRNHRKIRDQEMTNESQIDNKGISNDSLVALILSHNEIQYLPVMKFFALKRLQLQGNQIKEIRAFQKSKLPELQYLDLGQNQFTQVCTFYLPKLTTLKFQQMESLRGVDTLFKRPSQLPSLENIYFNSTKSLDFSFDVNLKNNELKKLKELYFNNVNFEFSTKQKTIFQVSTVEKITFYGSKFNHFPILKLPKITSLSLQQVDAYSMKNLQLSVLPSLTDLQIVFVTQKYSNQTENLNGNDSTKQGQKGQKGANLSKFLTCDFNFPKLKTLSFTNSTIGSLKGLENHVFSQLQQLQFRYVDTADKKLPKIKASNLKLIQILGFKNPNLDSFLATGFPKLSMLYLDFNEIESINQKTLSNLTQLKILSLQGNKLTKLICNKNLDKLTSLDISSNKMKIFPRIKAKNLTDIKWYGNQFDDLSELQNCDLPAIESIQFANCDFSKSGLPKLNFPGLQTLYITDSKLSDVQNLKKSNLPSLREISFTNNQIKSFPMINIPQLQGLYLDQNQITNIQFLQNSKLQNLNRLVLTNNPFVKIPTQLELYHLKTFQCSNVKLGTLPELDFPQLQEISVQFAELTNIQQFARGEYKLLKYLNLSNNKIEYLPRVEMQSLTEVVIDNNLIEDLSDFLDSDFNVTLMEWFSFQNNKIKKVPNLLFPNVKVIYLNDNPLKEFNCLTLLEYPQLIGIYLNNTQVSKMRIPKLPKLQEIQLNNSKVLELNWLNSLGPNMPKLRKLNLNDCSVTRVPNLGQLKNLEELTLFNTPINNVDGILEQSSIPKTCYLQLSLNVGGNYEKFTEKILKKKSNVSLYVYEKQDQNNQ